MTRKYGLYINGHYVHPQTWDRVPNALEPTESLGEVGVFRKDQDDPEIWEACLEGAWQSHLQIRDMGFFPPEERLSFLRRLRSRLEDQKENFAQLILQEVGKPISLARIEVNRALDTLSATIREAATLLGKEHPLPLSNQAPWKDFEGLWIREPRGPLLAITPFNFPLNLVLHKVAPALAVGCPVILKASDKARLSALCLADHCHAEGLPAGLLNVFHCDNLTTQALIQDSRIRHVSFTGSAKVGWALRQSSHKAFFLELGGAAPAFVDQDVNLSRVAQTLATSAFAYSGQTCISTQSIWIHEKVYDAFLKAFETAMNALPCGLPSREDVLCGPVISAEAQERIQKLESSLLQEGAQITRYSANVLESGGIHPLLFEKTGWKKHFQSPAFVEGLSIHSRFLREEAFAPLVALQKVSSFEDFVGWSNTLDHRLQTAVFSSNKATLERATRALDFGGVILNESPSWRFDAMPYGGRGLAGCGSEGPRFAMEDYMDRKSILKRIIF
jgi:acyl-CoA reductase-like NAD-dependent aldehyde dehydrogenase